MLMAIRTRIKFKASFRTRWTAVRTGNMGVVEFLHNNYTNLQCSTAAMDDAAGRGHLEVIKFLHFNRTEGCIAKVLINAVRFRYHATQLEVVKFLCENRSEGDVVAAMGEAAYHGHLKTVKYLHTKLPAGMSTDFAAARASRSYTILHYLRENR